MGSPATAKNRLTDIRTQEVSLVDHAANLTQFVVRKNGDPGAMNEPATKNDPATVTAPANGAPVTAAAPPPPPAAAPPPAGDAPKSLAMPQAAKDALLTGIAAAMDALGKIGEAVKGATPDEGAGVPPEVAAALGQVSDMLEGVEAQYEPAGGAPPPPDAGAPAGSAEKSGELPDVAKFMTGDEKDQAAEAMKGLPVRLQKKFGAAVVKYGRAISAANMAAIKTAASLLASLVKDADDKVNASAAPASAAAPAAPVTAAAPPPPVAAPPPAAAPAAKADDPAVAKLREEIATLQKRIGEVLESAKPQLELIAKVNAALSQPGAAKSGADNGDPPKPVAKNKPAHRWPEDLSAQIAAEKAAAATAAK